MANFPITTSYKPWYTDNTITLFYHEAAELIIHTDKIELIGNVKDAALALAKIVLADGSTSSTWNNIFRAIHGKGGRYTLEYLQDNKPDFFDELKRHFENVCKMKAFI